MEADDSFVHPIFFAFLDLFLYFWHKRFTVAIINQMAIISAKNPCSDSNSPGGDGVNQFPILSFQGADFSENMRIEKIFLINFFFKLGQKEAPFIC